MSSLVVPGEINTEPTRRRLSDRQAETVQRLVDAAVVEVRAEGYEGLTVRSVAAIAGVAPATAYTYFTSKDHLIAEVFWRRISTLEPVQIDRRQSPVTRVAKALREVATLVADEPELAAACTAAMLARDPEVKALRDRVGAQVHRRIIDALGVDIDDAVVRVLDLAYSGAMLQAGMGHLSYAEIGGRLAEVATLTMGATDR